MCLLGQNHPKSVLLQTKAVDGHTLLFMTFCGILSFGLSLSFACIHLTKLKS